MSGDRRLPNSGGPRTTDACTRHDGNQALETASSTARDWKGSQLFRTDVDVHIGPIRLQSWSRRCDFDHLVDLRHLQTRIGTSDLVRGNGHTIHNSLRKRRALPVTL